MLLRTVTARVALGLLGSLAAACGGSSSETPPPVRPDSQQLELRKPKPSAGSAPEARRHANAHFDKQGRAESTWGRNRRVAPRPAAISDAGITPTE